jgi:hypothetical protein
MDGMSSPPSMTLSHALPRMSPDARARVEKHLTEGCDRCSGTSATLTLRAVTGLSRPELQCDSCGRSLSGALKKADHYEVYQYPAFDIDKMNRFFVDRGVDRLESREGFHAQVAYAGADRQADYAQRLATDPSWHELRLRVMRRAGNVCEACLSSRAEHVHHLTYRFGVLPPAWMLRAVCRACHERLHADKYGRDDEWHPE